MKWRRLAAAVLALCCATIAIAAPERTETFQDIRVTIRGEGKPLLMIPGLTSAAAVWDETCAALQPAGIQCHIVQLPGFVGQSPVETDNYLEAMRDRLLGYLSARMAAPVAVMGHSMGGLLALEMAIKDTSRIERLVIVDSLPFQAAARDRDATAAGMKLKAAALRAGMLIAPSGIYRSELRAAMARLIGDPARLDLLEAWGMASDRVTTAKARYEILTTDLRGELGRIDRPTLVLAAWATYSGQGATRDGVRKMYGRQYASLPGARIELSEAGRHFLMWDDADWLVARVKEFLRG